MKNVKSCTVRLICRTPNQMSNCHSEPPTFVFLWHNNVQTLCVCKTDCKTVEETIAGPHCIEQFTTHGQKRRLFTCTKSQFILQNSLEHNCFLEVVSFIGIICLAAHGSFSTSSCFYSFTIYDFVIQIVQTIILLCWSILYT